MEEQVRERLVSALQILAERGPTKRMQTLYRVCLGGRHFMQASVEP
jgi:hypothetical protein